VITSKINSEREESKHFQEESYYEYGYDDEVDESNIQDKSDVKLNQARLEDISGIAPGNNYTGPDESSLNTIQNNLTQQNLFNMRVASEGPQSEDDFNNT
jgi:hypothetical protein